MNKYMQEAIAFRTGVDGLAVGQSDEKLVENKAAFPYWNPNGVDYLAGMLLQYNDGLYRVVQAHKSQADWTPDIVAALYNRVTADEYEEWESGRFYAKGAKVTHSGKKWVSNVDNNHWEPGATGVYTWDEVTE